MAGRGFGKTRAGAEFVLSEIKAGRAKRIALIAKTPADARDVMIEGDSGILSISPPTNKPLYEPSKRRLTWNNGATALIFSSKEPDQLRGPQYDLAWGDEIRTWYYPQETWDNLMFGLRLGEHPRCVVTSTPLPINVIRDIMKQPTTVITRGTTYENKANLAPTFFRQIISKYEGTRLGRQEINAELLEDVPGALWKRAMIQYKEAPELQRVVVAIDPATTSSEGSAETGIIVAGKGIDGFGYILTDRSARVSPDSWARRAVQAFDDYKADRIIGETNNGGEMIELTLKTVRNVPYKAVHASRGKQARAEPVAALYEQGKIFHVKPSPELEDQLTTWTPDSGESPDRLDACFVAGTMITTRRGQVPIEQIKPGMMVLTRKGFRQVLKAGITCSDAVVMTAYFSNGNKLTGTPEHRIFVKDKGFIPLNSLVWTDIIVVCKNVSVPLENSHQPTCRGLLCGDDVNAQAILNTAYMGVGVSQYANGGSPSMPSLPIWEKDHLERRLTVSTQTEIMNQITAGGRHRLNRPITHVSQRIVRNGGSIWHLLDPLPQYGIVHQKDLHGTVNTGKRHGQTERQLDILVSNVGRSTLALQDGIQIDSVQGHVYQGGTNLTSDIMKTVNVSFVKRHLESRNQRNKQSAPVHVLGLYAAGKAPVYNLQVQNAPEYFANGVLVHNCVWALTELMLTDKPFFAGRA